MVFLLVCYFSPSQYQIFEDLILQRVFKPRSTICSIDSESVPYYCIVWFGTPIPTNLPGLAQSAITYFTNCLHCTARNVDASFSVFTRLTCITRFPGLHLAIQATLNEFLTFHPLPFGPGHTQLDHRPNALHSSRKAFTSCIENKHPCSEPISIIRQRTVAESSDCHAISSTQSSQIC